MGLVEGIVNFANLSQQEQTFVIQTLRTIQESGNSSDEWYVEMDKEITEENARIPTEPNFN